MCGWLGRTPRGAATPRATAGWAVPLAVHDTAKGSKCLLISPLWSWTCKTPSQPQQGSLASPFSHGSLSPSAAGTPSALHPCSQPSFPLSTATNRGRPKGKKAPAPLLWWLMAHQALHLAVQRKREPVPSRFISNRYNCATHQELHLQRAWVEKSLSEICLQKDKQYSS